jgi:predicted nucleic acid-binding protein
MIGAHHLLVAATCLTPRCAIVTLNTREFKRVPGLSLARIAAYQQR